jgi:drug/metabolite transporter (DMT)-like permease
MEKNRAATYAIVAAALWGMSFPITKIGLENISPILFAFLRYTIASLLFIFLLFFTKNFYNIDTKKFVFLGIVGVTLPTILQNIGLKYTTAYITGFLQSTGPIYTVILAYIFLSEKINIYKILGIFLAFVGVYLMVRPEGGGNLFGNLLILSSAISYSIGGIIAKDLLNNGYKPLQIIAFSSIFGTIFLIPMIFFEKISFEYASIKYILFLAIFTTFIAYLLWYSAMEKMEVSKLSFFTYLIPLFSLISSHFLLQEEIKVATILAGFIAVLGVAIAQKA